MKVYEMSVKVYNTKDIKFEDSLYRISQVIDKTLAKDNSFLQFHNKNEFKNYSFNSFYPLEKDKIYKAGSIYTFKVRTIDEKLLEYLKKNLENAYTNYLKVLTVEVRIIPKKFISKIYSITPLVIKTDKGYWKGKISLETFEKRIKENIIKKYNNFFNEKIKEDFSLYDFIKIDNKIPVSFKYKDISILGDKITLNITDDEKSQDIAYLALGVGIGEMNSRGFGYVNFKSE